MKKTSFLIVLWTLMLSFCCSCALSDGSKDSLSSISESGLTDQSDETASNDGGSESDSEADTADSSSVSDENDGLSSENGNSSEAESSSDSGNGDSDSGDSGENDGLTHTYNDFTVTEKKTQMELFGVVIPFLPNDDYEFSAYAYEDETGVYFYTTGNTMVEFNAYREAFSTYTFAGSEVDEDGDTWYYYDKGNLYVDMVFYRDGSATYIEVYAYILTESGGDSGSGGGSDSEGSTTDVDVITNEGKGLPTGVNGVYDVDFTKATNVKDVRDQGYYSGGCPPTGKSSVLVIPVEFKDVTAASKGYTIATLKEAFKEGGKTDYFSLYDYYYTSSYGQLALDITVLDSWFQPQYNSTYYKNQTMNYEGEEIFIGDQLVMDEALQALESKLDLSKFDSDNNDIIDAVIMVNTLNVDAESDFNWAYRYWNTYTDDEGYYYEYDGVSANDYIWASYQFLHEDENGNYTNTSGVNTYTFIHEFGHVLGVDDYYDTAYVGAPMGGYDIMDSMMGDHNPYTKFNCGWITNARLITTDSSVSVSLSDFSKTGDTIILANNWDSALGAYQEYYIVAYYKNGGLNSGAGGYFEEDGIVVYHVNASLYKEVLDGETYYDVYNNNTDASDEYGTENNLIEYVLNDSGEYVYTVGARLPQTKLDGGAKLGYTFTVDALGETATLTVTKMA